MNSHLSNTMKLHSFAQSDTVSSMFLYGTFMFSNIDYVGILDYLLKAIIGALVWFSIKLVADYYTARIKQHVEHTAPKKKAKETEEDDDTPQDNNHEQG